MILEAVLWLLCAQTTFGDRPAPISASVPAAFPSIDQAARELEQPIAAWPSVEPSMTTTTSSLPAASGASTNNNSFSAPQFSLAGYPHAPRTDSVMEQVINLPTTHELVAEAEPAVELMSTNIPVTMPVTMSTSMPGVMSETGSSDFTSSPADLANGRGKLRQWFGRRSGCDYGLAYERVMVAPLVTETALGVPNTGLRFRWNRGASRPDRLEYLWSRSGKGPGPETRVDMLDSVFRTELGSARAVVITEVSMRSLDPDRAPNTTGFGDMVVGGKTLLVDGKCTKLSSIFLTYLNTGPADRGLGTGHVSLEPGLLGLHQWSDRTYLHGAVQYRIPLAATRGFAGDVLATSWAVSTVWQDSDTYAWMPVLEFQTHSFLFGSQTEPDGSIRRVDGTTALDILPGSRFALGQTALGLCEIGVSSGFRCSDSDWFDSRMMLDIRWVR